MSVLEPCKRSWRGGGSPRISMGPGCTVLVGIVVRYTLLYIIGGIMGASL